MDDRHKQNLIKLNILSSLARSQHALARIIESMSDVAESSDKVSKELLNNIALIANYQRVLAMSITSIGFQRKEKNGTAADPYLHKLVVRPKESKKTLKSKETMKSNESMKSKRS